MRYLTGVVRPVESIHPTANFLAEEASVTQIAIHQTRLLEDETCVTWLQVRGDRADLERVLNDAPSVLEYSVAGDSDRFVYLHSRPDDLARYLYEIRDSYELVVQMPLEFTDDGGLRGTVIGRDDTFQQAVSALPDRFTFEVERIGDYRPRTDEVFSGLTDHQQEILSTAIREGYYADPRRTSQKDIAAKLDVATGTVSQNLRRIEARVLSKFPLSDEST